MVVVMSNNNDAVRTVREALRRTMRLSHGLRDRNDLPEDNWGFSWGDGSYSLTVQEALDSAFAYALHFLRSNLLTRGEAAKAAAGVIGPYVESLAQALEDANSCLEQASGDRPWTECGPQFIAQVGPQLLGLRENLPLALLKSPPLSEFEEAVNYLGDFEEYFEGVKEQADETLSNIAEQQQSVDETAAEVANKHTEAQALLTGIRNALTEAESLQEDIENFREDFTELSKGHDALLDKLQSRESELELIISAAKEHEEKTGMILEAAREALGWAQASGLAGASHESGEQYRKALRLKGWGLLAAIMLLTVATTVYLVYGPAWIAHFLADLKQARLEPNAYIAWFVRALSFVPLLALGYGVWAMGVDYAVLRNLTHSYRHREVLARTLQAFRELGPEEEKAMITSEAFRLFLEDPMVRAYRGLSPLQRATGELKTLVGRAKGQIDIAGSDEGSG